MMHILCDVPGVWAGFTRFDADPDPVHWTPPRHETFMIIDGSVRIEIAGRRDDRAGAWWGRIAPRRHGDHLAHHGSLPASSGS